MTELSAAFFLSYLLGSVSFAIVVSRFRGLADPRTYGSGNPGATNMLRSGDRRAAFFTLLGDALKGFLAIVMTYLLFLPAALDHSQASLWLAMSAMGVFLGHIFPVFHGFKGGKGVATALGVLLGLSPWLGLAVLAIWLAMFLFTRISSLAAIASSIAAPLLSGLGLLPSAQFLSPLGSSSERVIAWQDPVWLAILAMSLILLLRHHRNILGLLRGEERAFGRGSPDNGNDRSRN